MFGQGTGSKLLLGMAIQGGDNDGKITGVLVQAAVSTKSKKRHGLDQLWG